MTTIAEEFLLLITRPEGGHGLQMADVAVAGALLGELAGRERVQLDERGRVQLIGSGPVGDPLLDEALGRFASYMGRKPKNVIEKAGRGLTQAAFEQLARAELVRPKERRALGLTWGSTWAPMDATVTDRVRGELLDVLAGRREPDLRTGSLVGLLRATSMLGRAFPKDLRGGLAMSEIRAAAKRVSKGRWASEAVQKAIEETQAAMTATFVAVSADSS